MRFERDVVHPSIFAASDKIVNQYFYGGGSAEFVKAYSEHSTIWFKEYGKSLGAGVLACVLSFAAVAATSKFIQKPVFVALMVSLVALWAIVGAVAYNRNRRSLTSRELKVLAPVMDLTPIQRIYAEALIAAAEAKLPDEPFREVTSQLNRLVDEEARLIALRDSGAGVPATHAEISAERDRIAERLAATEDPVTREALRRSLEICENRLHAATELSLVGQRVDAQIEMIGQAIRSIRDSLIRLQAAPASSIPSIDLDAVRHTVDIAHHHSVALEKAVEEVRTLA